MGALDFLLPTSNKYASSRIEAELDTKLSNTLWVTMRKDATGACQNFSLPLLNDLRDMVNAIKENGATWLYEGRAAPIHYAVMRSEDPDYLIHPSFLWVAEPG